MKTEIIFKKETCIGYGACEKADPNNFKLNGQKAELLNSKQDGENYSLTEDLNEKEFEDAVKAAQDCPVNAIIVNNLDKNETVVGDKLETDNLKEVEAQYDDEKEFVLDPAGYFLIKIDKDKQVIEVGFCNSKNKMILKVTGKKPIDIYQTILNKEKLDLRKDHAAYLGRELQKAYIALKKNLEYVQDDEL